MVSVDGKGALPVLFVEQMLPWMIQSPLMPNIAILMASYTQAVEQGLEARKYSETLSIKSHVLSLINAFLRQDFDLVGGEALRAVTHLVIIEVRGGRLLNQLSSPFSKVVLGCRSQFVGSHERPQADDQASRRLLGHGRSATRASSHSVSDLLI